MGGVRFFLAFLSVLFCVYCFGADRKKGSNLSPSVSIDPFVYIVKSTDPSDLYLTLSDEDIERARKIFSSNDAITGVYHKLASFAVCILSNDMKDSLILKVAKSDNLDYVKDTSGIEQPAMYNAFTGTKIRSLFVVKPAGWTMNPNSFGNSSVDKTPSKGVPFMVGGPVFSGNEYSVYLQSSQDSGLNRAVRLVNLELDSYGMVNHYGMNADLSDDDVGTEIIEKGSGIKLTGCQGYKNSDLSQPPVDMSITFDLYINMFDLANSSAGQYKMQFSIQWTDSNDLSSSTNVYGKDS